MGKALLAHGNMILNIALSICCELPQRTPIASTGIQFQETRLCAPDVKIVMHSRSTNYPNGPHRVPPKFFSLSMTSQDSTASSQHAIHRHISYFSLASIHLAIEYNNFTRAWIPYTICVPSQLLLLRGDTSGKYDYSWPNCWCVVIVFAAQINEHLRCK